ncbi:MAG: hypothetical protein RLY97_760 [Pseudomonadota bacterium]|jgi:Flp pilus assembly protein TadG
MIGSQGYMAWIARLRKHALNRHHVAALGRDQRGVAVLEFAFVAPVFIMMMMGIFNIGQMIYVKSLLNGAVQQAARYSGTENANTATSDNIVKSIVGRIAVGGVFTTTRTSYFDFADVNRAEKYTDTNGNGTCNNNEIYFDENSNGHWDANVGVTGNGAANDVVVMTTRVQYYPVFRIPFMPNQWQQFTISSTAVTKNQPFATQAAYSATTGTCP